MKDELGGKIMIEFVSLRSKAYPYLMDDGSENKKSKGTTKCVIKRILKFNHYDDCLFNNKLILQQFKSEAHKKVIGLMKDELGGKIMIEFVTFRPKTYPYLMDDGSENKKSKGRTKCVIKRILKFNHYDVYLITSQYYNDLKGKHIIYILSQ